MALCDAPKAKVAVTADTVYILDNKKVTAVEFFAEENKTIITIQLDEDNKTIIKLVATTKADDN